MAPSRQLLLVRKMKKLQLELIVTIVLVINFVCLVIFMWLMMAIVIHEIQKVKLLYREKKHGRLVNLSNLIRDSDVTCKSELCMNKRTFNIFCEMDRDIGGLVGTRYMSLKDIVAIFLYTLAHQFKNWTIDYFY